MVHDSPKHFPCLPKDSSDVPYQEPRQVTFIMNGKQKRIGYTDDFLKNFICLEGSTIVMFPTIFMTEYAWDNIMPHIIIGIISMPFIKYNPQ